MNILITGINSYIGSNVKEWLLTHSNHNVDIISLKEKSWIKKDFSKYDCIFHVAGIAHMNASKELYYEVNRDLTIEVANKAKNSNIKQFIFMSSMIVYGESISLNPYVISKDTIPVPNNFYGDSKLQAENELQKLQSDDFNICIIRSPMVYGKNSKGNFQKLFKFSKYCFIFPELHNERSMIYIDNLSVFVLQLINQNLSGIFYPQNAELSDTVKIVKYFNHNTVLCKFFNPLVKLCSKFIKPLNKMFGTYYYDQEMSKMQFDYQLVSFEESIKRIKDD